MGHGPIPQQYDVPVADLAGELVDRLADDVRWLAVRDRRLQVAARDLALGAGYIVCAGDSPRRELRLRHRHGPALMLVVDPLVSAHRDPV